MDKNRAKIIDFGVPKTRKIAKSMVLERPQHPQTPKLCGKRSISIIFPTKNFFSKIRKSQYFWDFSTRQNPKIRDLADPGMCPYLHMAKPCEVVWAMDFVGFREYESDIFEIFHRHAKPVLPKVAPGSLASAFITQEQPRRTLHESLSHTIAAFPPRGAPSSCRAGSSTAVREV